MNQKLNGIVDILKAKTDGFDASSYEGFLAVQVTLKDLETPNVLYIEVKDGILTIEPHEYADRQANIIISSDNFEKMIEGKLNSVLAFTTGKLKIEGEIAKAKELSSILKKQ